MSGKDYRSPGVPIGFFSQLGTIHIHADGAHDSDLVGGIVRGLEAKGWPGKVNRVLASIAGPQRQDLPEAYLAHTPGDSAGVESFEYFSTATLPNRATAITVAQHVVSTVANSSGIIVELERVIATIDSAGRWDEVADAITPVAAIEVGYRLAQTLPVEIHHAIDIPKSVASQPPLMLEQFMDVCSAAGIRLGGWFLFEKPNEWAYRSNQFLEVCGLKATVLNQYAFLQEYMRSLGIEHTLRTLIEQVLGVWRTPIEKI